MSSLNPLQLAFTLALLLLSPAGGQVALQGTRPGPSHGPCDRKPSDTKSSKTPGDNGFRLQVLGTPEYYKPNKAYTVSVNGTFPGQKFLRFSLVAVPRYADDERRRIGRFKLLQPSVTRFAPGCPHVVTGRRTSGPLGSAQVEWVAPAEGTGCIELRATVLEYQDIWYQDDGALTHVFCEQSGTGEDGMTSDELPECCACGSAKYQITFHGLWSWFSHPKQFPQQRQLLHWSNIVGASHEKGFRLWQYGSYASKGVKDVCEFGYPREIEKEIRAHSDEVRTVLKMPGIWWEPDRDLRQTRWARFSVDSKRHLLSLLSMIGPSPDWCAGVSSLNLCMRNCSWAQQINVKLFPWDAGTDDGITYMSINQKSEPQQKIHKITNTFPNDPDSPFYGPNAVAPLAILNIRRLHPKLDAPAGECSHATDDEELDDDGMSFSSDEMKKQMMLKAMGKCRMSEWADWTSCSVTCGIGLRIRKRAYLNEQVSQEMCGMDTMQTEKCIGVANTCDSPGLPCTLVAWSEWSPCSSSCGKGVQERRRYYLEKIDERKCSRKTSETQSCSLKSCPIARKNFTGVCGLASAKGPCRGDFTRWYFHSGMRRCVPFSYGGCRGNNNRFRSHRECEEVCFGLIEPRRQQQQQQQDHQHHHQQQNHHQQQQQQQQRHYQSDMRQPLSLDCQVTDWSSWSTCSASCGRGYKYQRRRISRDSSGSGLPCPRKMQKKTRCDLVRCPLDCQLGSWSAWSACSRTCGRDVMQERTRPLIRKPRRGGLICGDRGQRRTCRIPDCPQANISSSQRYRGASYREFHP